jgi:hypothetical protein
MESLPGGHHHRPPLGQRELISKDLVPPELQAAGELRLRSRAGCVWNGTTAACGLQRCALTLELELTRFRGYLTTCP